MKTLSAIRAVVRQRLRDELTGSTHEFEDDEIDIHISDCLVDISQKRPYEVKETLVSDGTKEVDISDVENLLEVVKAEYPTGNDPPDYRNVSLFGDTLRLNIDTTPTSGENVYVYCHKVHQLTESTSTLNHELESVLEQGVVAKTALAWVNNMRDKVVAQSVRWYESWANNQFLIYQNKLNQLTRPKVWEFYSSY